MERRAIRDRISLDRHQAMRNQMIKGDLSEWLEHRLKGLEESHTRKETENVAIMRNVLRGSKRRKRAFISELQSGSLRRALSEDELGPADEENEQKDDHNDIVEAFQERKGDLRNDLKDDHANPSSYSKLHPILVDLHACSDQRQRRHAGHDEMHSITNNLESLTVQSEFGFPTLVNTQSRRNHMLQSRMEHDQHHHHNMSYYNGQNSPYMHTDILPKDTVYNRNQDQSLEVSDHPHVYQNTGEILHEPENRPASLLSSSIRRNSIRYVYIKSR